jgi:hypothetical protein
MTAPRALTRTLSDAMRRQLADLGDAVKPKDERLFSRISQVLQDDTATEARATALLEQARRVANPRTEPDAEAVAEVARRRNINSSPTRGYDQVAARATREKSAVARVLDGVEQPEGATVPSTSRTTTKESRAASRADKKVQNKARWAKRNADIAAAGGDKEKIAQITKAYDDETARLTGGAGRSAAAQATGIGTGPKAEMKEAARAARSQVNADLRAGKIDAAEAEARYAIIKQQEPELEEMIRARREDGDLTTRTKVGDAADIRDGRYYDLENPEAMDRPIINGVRKVGMRPGGLNERVVTASAVVRRHINELIASGDIPAAPPDAAMPGIIRTAMKEMGTDDSGFDDHALMRAYRQQSRRGSAFSRRRPQQDPADLPRVDDIDEAGEAAGLKMLDDLGARRVRRQEAEEGFVDDAARMLANDADAFDAGYETPRGLTSGRALARDAQRATMVPPPEGANFKQLESFRRGRGRAARQANQFDAMDEGAGEYALERNEKVARRREAEANPKEPKIREYFAVGEPEGQLGGTRVTRTQGTGGAPASVFPRPDPTPTAMRPESGRQQVFPSNVNARGTPMTPRSRFDGVTPDGTPGPDPRMGRQGPRYAAGEPESPAVVMREVEDENNALLAAVESGQLSREEAAGYMMDNMRRVEQAYENLLGTAGGRQMDAGPTGVSNWSPESMEQMRGLGVPFEQGPRQPNYPPQPQEPSWATTARNNIEGEADQDVDRLVRMLMDRVGRMAPAERDQFFASQPGGLDQMRMMNRNRSQTLGQVMRPEVDFRGEPLDVGRPGAVPFPSQMQRQMPQDPQMESIIAQVLAAINAGR